MNTIMAYFNTDKKATIVEEKHRRQGFRSEISIFLPNNKAIFNEVENQGEIKKENHSLNTDIYGIYGGIGGAISLASTMTPRYEPMNATNTISNLRKKVPKEKMKEVKNISAAGNTVIFIESSEDNSEFIKNALKENEAKLI